MKEALGYKCHWAVANYLQRAARHIASGTDVEQAHTVGRAAVETALAVVNAIMPTIESKSNAPYRWAIGKAQLKDVTNVERPMPRKFISADGFGITETCRRYLAPLIAGEGYPPYAHSLPRYVTLKKQASEQAAEQRL